ncbi:hypothetical protein [Streptomyces afghaniensis]|uniref:hypothetical protein n=1 Tax=Streptomyces afghaniensis TaxID=66865 RepID=UPI0027D8365F|nr:hypothetical protein [Streptomyces afghaniensis]
MPDRDSRDVPSPRAQRATDPETYESGTYEAGSHENGTCETDAERRRRRARFLRDLAEARELRDRVQPRRVKVARLRHAMRMRTFRW